VVSFERENYHYCKLALEAKKEIAKSASERRKTSSVKLAENVAVTRRYVQRQIESLAKD
jgi:spore coat protein CotH